MIKKFPQTKGTVCGNFCCMDGETVYTKPSSVGEGGGRLGKANIAPTDEVF